MVVHKGLHGLPRKNVSIHIPQPTELFSPQLDRYVECHACGSDHPMPCLHLRPSRPRTATIKAAGRLKVRLRESLNPHSADGGPD